MTRVGWRWLVCLVATLVGMLALSASPSAAASGVDGGVDGGVSDPPTPQGGVHGELKTRQGHERHHMIATKVLQDAGYGTACGPAIRMEIPDHYRTPSRGNGGKQNGRGEVWTTAQEYRDRQAAILADPSLSEDTRFRRIIEVEIEAIRDLFGSKYDQAIAEMLERYQELRDLLDARGLDWKSLQGGGSGGCGPPSPVDPRRRDNPAPATATVGAWHHDGSQWLVYTEVGPGQYEWQPAPGEVGAPVIASPLEQQELRYDAVTSYHVSVRQDPSRSLTLAMDFGDGAAETATVPAGSGYTVVTFRHNLYHPDSPGGPHYGVYTQQATILETGAYDQVITVHDC